MRYIPIAYKLALAITLLLTSGMGLLGLVVVTNQGEQMRSQMNEYGRTMVNQLSESAKDLVLSDDNLGLRVLTNNLTGSTNILGAGIYSVDGTVLASNGAMPPNYILIFPENPNKSHSRPYSKDWLWQDDSDKGTEVVSFISPIRFQEVVAGYSLVTFSRAYLVQSQQKAVQTIIGLTIFMTLLATIVAFLMSRRLTHPIHDLVTASREIGEGNYGFRLPSTRNDELGTLTHAFNDMAKGLEEKTQVENTFSRYVSTEVAKQILDNLDQVRLGGKHVNASVMFADIVGFTRISEQLPANEVAELLNEYFTFISRAAKLYSGHIDKFIGDCAMVVFGVPKQDQEHPFHAIACAVMILHLSHRLNEIRKQQGKFPVYLRIGVNSGDMLAGNMGSDDRMEYTVVGDTVNLAERLSSMADSQQIVIRDTVYQLPSIKSRVKAQKHGPIRVRGRISIINTYIVEDVLPIYRKVMDQQIDRLICEYGEK